MQRNQSFMEMIRSAKGSTHEDEHDDEEEFVLKKEVSATVNHKGTSYGTRIVVGHDLFLNVVCFIPFGLYICW